MSNEFTKDIAQWAIDDESVYTENPEFIYVKKDADDRLLWWIYADGSVDWSKGVPTPIQEELKKLEQLIKDNSEGNENIVSRITANEASIVEINSSLESVVARVSSNEAAIVATNETLDRKVDGVYEESPEFIRYYCDADGRLIWWIYADGSVDWSKGVPTPIQEELKKLEQLIKDNSEGNENIVSRVASNEAAIVSVNEALDRKVDGVYEESPEFIRYYCDADGRLIWWIYPDGSVDWANGVPQPIQVELRKLEQLISEGDSSISEQIEAINKRFDDTPILD